MKSWEWECITTCLSTCSVVECGPLHGPITGFKLTRNEDLQLILETSSAAESSSNASPALSGTVRRSIEEVRFSGHSGSTAVARGVVPYNLNLSQGRGTPDSVKAEQSRVHTIDWRAADGQETAHTIQWIENMPSQFIWPHSVDRKNIDEKTMKYRGDGFNIELCNSSESQGFSRSCVHLSIFGLELFLVKAQHLKMDGIRSPGFIIYKGNPSNKIQNKIIDIMSFCLGKFLINLGFTNFDSDWKPVFSHAKSAYTMHGSALKLITSPPAPLNRESYNEIDKSLLERMMEKLGNIYDEFELQSVFWAYWHAAAAPVHIAAVHYGAAIESLQRKYAEQQGTNFKTTLLEIDIWKKLSAQIKELIDKSDINAEEISIISRKIQSLNNAPQTIIMERFLVKLGIKGGTVELSAWNKRNRAAHGSRISQDNIIEFIRDNKALMIFLNRILLAISCGSTHYHNYYTVGHPISALASPIPAEH